MDPINNIGAANYAMSVPQNQNQDQIQGYDDYASMPMVYEPETEEKKKASSGMLGLTALGIVAAAGIGIFAGKKMGQSGVKKELEELRTLHTELKTKYDAAEAAKKVAEDAKAAADNSLKEYREAGKWTKFVRIFKPNYKLSPEEIDARKAAKEAKKEAEKAAKEAKKADKAADAKKDDTSKS